MKLIKMGFLVAAALGTFTLTAQEVAILRGRGDCDGALAKLGVETAKYPCTATGMKSFTEEIGKYRLVLTAPLFNYAGAKNMLPDGATDVKAIRAWIKAGGVLVMTECNYLNARGWFETIDLTEKGSVDSESSGLILHTTLAKIPRCCRRSRPASSSRLRLRRCRPKRIQPPLRWPPKGFITVGLGREIMSTTGKMMSDAFNAQFGEALKHTGWNSGRLREDLFKGLEQLWFLF